MDADATHAAKHGRYTANSIAVRVSEKVSAWNAQRQQSIGAVMHAIRD